MKELNFTKEELVAVHNILTACIDQHKTSGGDIDYTGLGERGLDVMQNLLKKMSDPCARCTKIITEYSASGDMTFILKEEYNAEGDPLSTEVVGFYFGKPNEKDTEHFTGKLKAEFVL